MHVSNNNRYIGYINMIKTATVFKFNKDLTNTDILKHAFQTEFIFNEKGFEVNPKEKMIVGFDKFNEEQDFLNTDDYLGIKFKIQEKNLPKNHINEKLKDKINAIKIKENRTVGKKEKQELKEQVIQEMLPHAFINTSYVHFYFDFANHLLYIDTASEKKYSIGLSLLTRSEEYQLNPELMVFEKTFGSTLRKHIVENWFNSADNETQISTANACTIEISDNSTDKIPTINVKNMSMLSQDVAETLSQDNRFISAIDLMLDDVEFSINEKFIISKIKNPHVKKKFNPDEESLQEFNLSNMLIELNTLYQIVSDIQTVLES